MKITHLLSVAALMAMMTPAVVAEVTASKTQPIASATPEKSKKMTKEERKTAREKVEAEKKEKSAPIIASYKASMEEAKGDKEKEKAAFNTAKNALKEAGVVGKRARTKTIIKILG